MRNYESGLPWLHGRTDPLNFTIVIATWSNRGGKLLAGNRRRLAETLPDGLADVLPLHWVSPRLFELFPSLIATAEHRANERNVTASDLTNVYPGATVHIEDTVRFRDFEERQMNRHRGWSPDPFSLSMFYKIWQADVLRRNAEVELGRPFDVIIRARPDFPFAQPTAEFLRGVSDREIYVDRLSVPDRSVGDGFALGRPESMSIYAGFFHAALEKVRAGTWRYIHTDLFEYLTAAGLIIRTYPLQDYSPDRLLTATEVIGAIAMEQGGADDPVAINRQTVARSATLMVAALKGELALASAEFMTHMDQLIAADRPAQDSGFFYAVSGLLARRGEGLAALLCLAVAAEGLRVSETRAMALEMLGVPEDYFERCTMALSALLVLPGNVLDGDFDFHAFAHAHPPTGPDGKLIVLRLCAGIHDMSKVENRITFLFKLIAHNPGRCVWLSGRQSTVDAEVWADKVLALGLESNPDSSELAAALGALRLRSGQHAEAATFAAKAMNGGEPNSSFEAGRIFISLGAFDEAATAFRQAIRLNPSNADYYMLMSEALLHGGHDDEAVQFATEAAARSPFPLAHRHNNLAHVLLKTGRLHEAEEAFTETLRRNPDWNDVSHEVDDLRRQLAKRLVRTDGTSNAGHV